MLCHFRRFPLFPAASVGVGDLRYRVTHVKDGGGGGGQLFWTKNRRRLVFKKNSRPADACLDSFGGSVVPAMGAGQLVGAAALLVLGM